MASRALRRPELYDEEYEFVSTNPFAEALRPVFEIAGVDYGRVDFGLVGGRPQIYEINTNPDIKLRPPPGKVQRREESLELFRANYLEAMRSDRPRPTARAAKRLITRTPLRLRSRAIKGLQHQRLLAGASE